jgi:hypothetical protein
MEFPQNIVGSISFPMKFLGIHTVVGWALALKSVYLA